MKAVVCLLLLAACAGAKCLPVEQAEKHIGSTGCVSGTVVGVSTGPGGVQYLDFCPRHDQCAFSGVVFAGDLRDVGDIRTLAGKPVEIHGDIREYDGHAEIIVNSARQLHGAALPPVPKTYDVENRGHVSAGTARAPKIAKPKKSKRRVVPEVQPPE